MSRRTHNQRKRNNRKRNTRKRNTRKRNTRKRNTRKILGGGFMLPPGSKIYELKDGNEVLMYIFKVHYYFNEDIDTKIFKFKLLNTDGKTDATDDYIVKVNTIIKDPNDTVMWSFDKKNHNEKEEQKRQAFIQQQTKEADLELKAHKKYAKKWEDYPFTGEPGGEPDYVLKY